MSLLFCGSQKFIERVNEKIKKATGLEDKFLVWYKAFNAEADFGTGIVVPKDVKDSVYVLLLTSSGPYTQKQKDIFIDEIDNLYTSAAHIFERKQLIDYHTLSNGCKYPRVIGYNFLNDPEFFVAHRLKGEKVWNGRLSMPINMVDITRHLSRGYEFREKDVINSILN